MSNSTPFTTTDWAEIKAQWGAGWDALGAKGLREHAAQIKQNPEAFRRFLENYLGFLGQARANLRRIHESRAKILSSGRALPSGVDEVLGKLTRRYQILGAGVYSDSRKQAPAEVGAVQVAASVVLVIGAVAFGLAAIAWAIVGYQYCKSLRDQTALAATELEKRAALAEQGLTLPPSTLPAQGPDGGDSGGGGVVWALGGLGVVGLLGAGAALAWKMGLFGGKS
jgi:hypothetical protein